MRAVPGFDTVPERLLRSALWRRGLRYRVHRRIAGARPDIVFGPAKVAVFVDGCFWHGCPLHYRAPKSNQEFWIAKVESNRARDRRNVAALEAEGYLVLRYFTCDLKGGLERIVLDVAEAIRARIGRRAARRDVG